MRRRSSTTRSPSAIPIRPNLVGATVTISGNYANGQDVLSFTNTANISGSFNAVTGTLTLTGTDTVANYQAALRTVMYFNASENPSSLPRTVTWVVDDGSGINNLSAPVTSTINVISVNDAPQLANGSTITLHRERCGDRDQLGHHHQRRRFGEPDRRDRADHERLQQRAGRALVLAGVRHHRQLQLRHRHADAQRNVLGRQLPVRAAQREVRKYLGRSDDGVAHGGLPGR